MKKRYVNRSAGQAKICFYEKGSSGATKTYFLRRGQSVDSGKTVAEMDDGVRIKNIERLKQHQDDKETTTNTEE